MSIKTRLQALEQRAGNSGEPPIISEFWLIDPQTSTRGRQHAQATTARLAAERADPWCVLVCVFEGEHCSFRPPAPCWCGTAHRDPITGC
jgi:hypothetical protein